MTRGYLFVLVFLSVATAFAAPKFEIVRNGRPVCACLTDGSPRQKALAAEFAAYVQKMTGAKLAMADEMKELAERPRSIIRFDQPYGASALDELAAFVNKDGRTLDITGDQPRGTVYALYAVLERLGVRFWSSHYETIPRVKDLSLPADFRIVEKPAFVLRAPGGECEVTSSAWCAKARLNVRLDARIAESYKFDCTETLCLRYLDPKKYFKEHPDWYAWRLKTKNGTAGRVADQPCLSNPEVLDKLLEEVRADLKNRPGLKYVSVAYNDNDKICQCDRCQKAYKNGGSSGMIARAASFVARGIAQEWPNVKVSVLSYWFTCPVPKGVKLEPNVSVCFCVGGNMLRPQREDKALVARLDGWLKLSHQQAVMWDYYANFSRFSFAVPNVDLMADNIRWHWSKGVRGFTSQLTLGGTAHLCDLRSYVYCKCLWNPNVDTKKLIDEWFENVCGKGVGPVRKYYNELLSVRDKNPVSMGMYGGNIYDFITAKDLIRWQRYFEEALALTKDDADRHEMVERMSAAPLMDLVMFYHKKGLPTAAVSCGYKLPKRLKLVKDARALFGKYNAGCYFSEHLGFNDALMKVVLTPEEKAAWSSFLIREKTVANGALAATIELDTEEPSLDGEKPLSPVGDIDEL